jgi:acyl-CoA reductase-like NAD-dependent aldehyde dehydrogenase
VESKSGETFSVTGAYDGATIPTPVHIAGPDDIEAAVAAAKAALPGWKSMKASDRQKCMLKLADLMEENLEDLAIPETVAMGQPHNIAKWIGAMSSPWWRYYAGWTDKIESRMSTPEYGYVFLRLVSLIRVPSPPPTSPDNDQIATSSFACCFLSMKIP